MTTKEKAKELVDKMYAQASHDDGMSYYEAIDCTKVAVNELINNTDYADEQHLEFWKQTGYTGYKQFWMEVKQEIQNL